MTIYYEESELTPNTKSLIKIPIRAFCRPHVGFHLFKPVPWKLLENMASCNLEVFCTSNLNSPSPVQGLTETGKHPPMYTTIINNKVPDTYS